MRTITVHSIDAFSLARLFGTWWAIVGFVWGFFASFAGSFTYMSQSTTGNVFNDTLAVLAVTFLALIIIPIIAFALGWINGFITGFIFDFVISRSGGLKMTVADDQPQA